MNKLEIEAPPGEDISKILDSRRKSWMKSKKFEEQLEADKIQPEVLKEVIEEVDEHQASHIQEVLERILQYTPLQVVLLVLAIIDVAIVVSEILVTLHIYDIDKIRMNAALVGVVQNVTKMLNIHEANFLSTLMQQLNSTLNNCLPNRTATTAVDGHGENERLSLLSSSHSHYFYNPELLDRPRKLLRVKRNHDDEDENVIPSNGLPEDALIKQLHLVEKILNIASIVILGIFVVVAILKIIAEGRHFFSQVMEIIDSIVVTLSFILDILKFTKSLSKDATEAVIVILLLWQIVRMFNGIMLSELKRLDFRIKLLKRTRKRVETKLSTVNQKMKQMEREIHGLKKLSRQKGALEEEIVACRPSRAIKPSALAGLSCIASMSVGLSISTPMAADLIEHKHNLLQSLSRISKSSFTSCPNDEQQLGGLSLVAMFPSETSSCVAVETEESTADADPASPTKKVSFGGGDDDDDDGRDSCHRNEVFDDDGDDDNDAGSGCKVDDENNKVKADGAKKIYLKRQTSFCNTDGAADDRGSHGNVFKLSRNYDADHGGDDDDDGQWNEIPVSHV